VCSGPSSPLWFTAYSPAQRAALPQGKNYSASPARDDLPSNQTIRHPSLEHCPLPHDTYDAIAKLQSFHEQDLPAASQADYRSAIVHFIETAERIAVAGAHYECGAVLVWPYHVQPSLLADLRARRPHGLLVLAYYCVFLALLEKPYWFSRGWSRQLMGEIEASFAGQPMFLDMMKWPKRIVNALWVA
jgi:hypothetical protein